MKEDTGRVGSAETGSRASMEPSCTVSTLTGFDPARMYTQEHLNPDKVLLSVHKPREMRHAGGGWYIDIHPGQVGWLL